MSMHMLPCDAPHHHISDSHVVDLSETEAFVFGFENLPASNKDSLVATQTLRPVISSTPEQTNASVHANPPSGRRQNKVIEPRTVVIIAIFWCSDL